ncbi:MAG: endonuclease/exonuclease/phosphatase family protein [Gemmatimonadetes bacterium]|nr:endonuclease/exonuclease/phosphatase family protein [Gemmatimonadota bacterium]
MSPIVVDPQDAPNGAAVDLGVIHAAADGHHIFFAVETGRPVNAQAMRGTLSILIDADDDRETGEAVGDFPGTDLVVELSRQDLAGRDGHGSGMALRELGSDGLLGDRTNAGGRDLVVAPTASASRFEIRLARGALERGEGRVPTGSVELEGPLMRARFVFSYQGSVVDETESVTLTLPPLEGDAPPRWSEGLDPTGDLRVLVWNVSSERFRDRPERFARVMAAMDPDVLLLDEVYGAVTEADLRAFFSRPELAAREPWEFVLGKSGGRQKTVVASRVGIRPELALEDVLYPDGALGPLAERFPEAERLWDLERERGLATTGAWVEAAGQPILFVPIDLQSAGYDGSFEDHLRVLQARTLRAVVMGALADSGRPAGVVIGGDLNLVGSHVPLDSLVHGLDGARDLIPVDTYRLTDRSIATWRNPDTQFTPGRLDYVLISSSTLSADQAFAFEVGELSTEMQERLGLAPEDTRLTADHLPLVVDLSITGDPAPRPGPPLSGS